MSTFFRASTLLLPLILSVPAQAYAKKQSATVQGGNQVQNSYTFKNDQFGSGDVLNLQATTGKTYPTSASIISTKSK